MLSSLSGRKMGHLLALFTILVWGTTFVSTTVVLRDFSPLATMTVRMVIAIIALVIARPKTLKLKSPKHELYFAGAGLFGVTLYILLENYALTYTLSGNCSVIISTAPFFVAIAMRFFANGERMNRHFYIGFLIAIFGIGLLSLSGQALQINPLGDLLCVLAAISWAMYSVFIKRMEAHGYDTLLATRRIFCYGLLFSALTIPFVPFEGNLASLFKAVNLLNFLYLGVCASALCFVTWSVAIKHLGAVKTSVYIYLSPVVTILSAWLILGDPLLPMAILGAVLTLLGLVVSQFGTKKSTNEVSV